MKDRQSGFSLAEILIATAILSTLLVLLTALLSGVNKAWTRGEQQAAQFQDGRAILELISRELGQAVISSTVQFVHDPNLNGAPQRGNSDCVFWVAPASVTANGSLSEIGYYLSDNYELKRFYVPPSDATNYQIFSAPNQPTDTAAPWVTNFVTNQNLSTTVASGVLAFWARCLDRNGDPIPWLSNFAGSGGGGRFNSAARFQPALAGQASSFKYTSSSTNRANLLPTFVELAIVTLDPQSFARNPSIPTLPAQTNETDLPNVRDTFNQQLINNNVKTARTFATRVRLVNADQ
jgi:prepilin-type N-terminal cleavage/methylation domain-containing protein